MHSVRADDPRGPKAVALATDAGQWLKCRAPSGQKYYGIPSSTADRYYLTTQQTCTCPDFERRGLPCKHILAVRLHCELIGEQRLAAVNPVHQLDERFGANAATLCCRKVSPRRPSLQVTLDRSIVTCVPCQQIQQARDKMNAEVANGTFWNRFR
jgi:SWIM zinc finger